MAPRGRVRSENVDKNPEELAEIRNLPVAELADRLDGLTASDLATLRALEAEDQGGRKTALEAIDAQLAKLAPAGENEETPPETTQPAAPAPTEQAASPDWQSPDYLGPLDIEQAQWRNANIKPVGATTKPVKVPKTK